MACLKEPNSRRTSQLYFTPQLAIHLTKSLCSFVDIYNIKWWESHETVCLPIIFTKLVAHNANRDIQVRINWENTFNYYKTIIHLHRLLALVLKDSSSASNNLFTRIKLCYFNSHRNLQWTTLPIFFNSVPFQCIGKCEIQH